MHVRKSKAGPQRPDFVRAVGAEGQGEEERALGMCGKRTLRAESGDGLRVGLGEVRGGGMGSVYMGGVGEA